MAKGPNCKWNKWTYTEVLQSIGMLNGFRGMCVCFLFLFLCTAMSTNTSIYCVSTALVGDAMMEAALANSACWTDERRDEQVERPRQRCLRQRSVTKMVLLHWHNTPKLRSAFGAAHRNAAWWKFSNPRPKTGTGSFTKRPFLCFPRTFASKFAVALLLSRIEAFYQLLFALKSQQLCI